MTTPHGLINCIFTFKQGVVVYFQTRRCCYAWSVINKQGVVVMHGL